MIFMRAMREVEARNGHASFQQLTASLHAAGHRPQRAHHLQQHGIFSKRWKILKYSSLLHKVCALDD
jgi:hypothetical protein